MKLSLKTPAFVAILSLMAVCNVAEATTRRTDPQAPITTISQRPDNQNTELLIKAATNFWQSDRYLTESQSLITAKTRGGTVLIELSSKTIAQSGAKFRSEITFGEDEDKASYVVVSDGEQVWIYHPKLKQYSITSTDEFKEVFLIGMSSVLFMQFPEESREIIAQNQSSKSVLEALGLLDNSSLKVEQGIINNQQMSVYKYFNAEDGFNISSFIEPATGILKQLQFGGESSGYDILITEKNIQRTPEPEITNETFKFIPPAGVKKVDSLSIEMF
ncbi:MAG TPA: hypothetical protein VK184_02985 [Nostocaceae cyanobacterium]|nr:hypothetical protein [Nostocaceae cyanobacterium]